MPKFYTTKLPLAERIEYRTIPEPNSGCLLWTGSVDKRNYPNIGIKNKTYYVSRVVWEMSEGPIPSGRQVCHKCDNPFCVSRAHLFLGTPKDNTEDKIRKGRHPRGEQSTSAVLTAENVVEIRSRRGESQRILAKEFGVNQSQISRVLSGERWAHL